MTVSMLEVSSGRPRLLVFDDDPVMREIIATIAERQGFDARMVSSHEDFFHQVSRWKPTHITIDLMMPRKDGIEVLRDLAATKCNAAIGIISGIETRVIESARRVAVERGLNIVGTLVKPFKHDALRALLGRAVPRAEIGPGLGRQTPLMLSRSIVAEALEQDQFVLHYQPKVNLATGAISGFEALVRWQHPLLGLLMPDLFVAEMELRGCISLLTQRVFETGLKWLASAPVAPEVNLAINLSALDLGTLRLADRCHEQAKALDIDPARIILELTETSAMTHPEIALATLARLRIKGFGLAIDDFGTGYSSMVQLARLPFSSMKIDRTFVMSMETSTESRKIIASIISLGHSLGLNIVAEGVETLATARALRSLGCDTAQGYGIARPMSAAAVENWLDQWQPQTYLSSISDVDQESEAS